MYAFEGLLARKQNEKQLISRDQQKKQNKKKVRNRFSGAYRTMDMFLRAEDIKHESHLKQHNEGKFMIEKLQSRFDVIK